MATKRFYFHTETTLNGAPTAPTGCATLSETAPDQTDANGGGGGHLSTSSGVTSSLLNKPFAIDVTEVAGEAPTTAPPASAHRFGWFSDQAYSGTFATGNWSAVWREFDNRVGIAGHAVLNIYASTTRDFSGTWRLIKQFHGTSADWWSGTATPGAALAAQSESVAGFTLANEYLFFQVWCH